MRVRLLGEADEELTAASIWYQQRGAGLGERLLEEAVEGFSAIGRNPRRFAKVRFRTRRDIRRYLLPHFPYAIVYEVREKGCLVVAVAHTARRPGYWAERLK
jgi:plasmid stabilization system protein ParE